jgi:hypothetical protein
MADWQLAFQSTLIGSGFLLTYIGNSIKAEEGQFLPSIFKAILYIGAFGFVLYALGNLVYILDASSINNSDLDGIAGKVTVLGTYLFFFLVVSLFIIALFHYIKKAVNLKSGGDDKDYEKL